MTGKGHIITGTMLAVDACMFTHFLALQNPESAKIILADNFVNPIVHYHLHTIAEDPSGIQKIQMAAISVFFCILLYITGLLLPDIDHRESTLSKILKTSLDTPHRGITHSVWFIFPFVLLGIYKYPFFYLAAGIIVHDIMDAFSKGGICPLYPLGKHKVYCGTVIRTKNKRIGYRTGSASEKVFITAICVCSFLLLSRI